MQRMQSSEKVAEAFLRDLNRNYFLPIPFSFEDDRQIDLEVKVCRRCLPLLYEIMTVYERATFQDDRPRCLCGQGCILQYTDETH